MIRSPRSESCSLFALKITVDTSLLTHCFSFFSSLCFFFKNFLVSLLYSLYSFLSYALVKLRGNASPLFVATLWSPGLLAVSSSLNIRFRCSRPKILILNFQLTSAENIITSVLSREVSRGVEFTICWYRYSIIFYRSFSLAILYFSSGARLGLNCYFLMRLSCTSSDV